MFPSRVAAAYYLAGIIDGEGSVTMRGFKTKAGHTGHARDVRVTNTDEAIIEATKEAFDHLGIAYRVYTRRDRAEQPLVLGSKPLMDVVVSNRPGLEQVLAEVPLRCTRKLAKLQEAVGSYTNYGQMPDRDVLAQAYEKGGDRGAATRFGVSPGTIFNWRQKLSIEARPRKRLVSTVEKDESSEAMEAAIRVAVKVARLASE